MEEEIKATRKVKSIRFGLMSPRMIKEVAAAKVVTPELYDKEGYPVDGGLMDIRLGVIDPGLVCKTDGQKLKESLGHFGYMSLARPVVHVKFVRIILDLLRGTCRECGRVLIPEQKREAIVEQLDRIEEEEGMTGRRREFLSAISELKTVSKCPHCNAKQKKVKIEKPTTFTENDKRITPIEVRTRLEKIPDRDIYIFGINPEIARPEWMILTILPIPPVTMRPSITLESGERSEDDLTHKLGDIVRINQRLFENINAGAPEIIIEDLWDLLQYHITTYFDNDDSQIPPARHRSGQPLKTLTTRIKSKEGRIRHNLAGKRTNFSARTVISPDPRLELNEVGVPLSVAMKLTIPERITEWNFEYLKKFVDRGPKKYPGSNYIVRPDGKKKKITDETREQLIEEIQPGYVVERHLMDGDISIFNRQPSLHRMSMMCHRVKVLPGNTFRLNPAVCAPYNADFDGDEMNLHIPQTEEARSEAEELMQVQTQIVSPRYGLSIIGCNMDALSGNYLLTRFMKVTKKEAVDLLSSCSITDFSRLPDKPLISGNEVFSVLIPKDFNFIGTTKKGDPIIIESGNVKKGYLDSANLGEGSGLMLRNINKRYGADKSLVILGRFFRMGVQAAHKMGVSVNLADTDLDAKSEKDIKNIIEKAEKRVDELIELFRKGKLEALTGRTEEETLELRILEVLNKARNDSGKIVAENAKENTATNIMAYSGAKGKTLNIAQMAACVGQQAYRGGRINKGFKGRTLSCFSQGDLGTEAHGFIARGFKAGMKPNEFFFMAMTGRDSLMDTALRTPKSGYLYRRLANALQDLRVEYDLTVRDASNKIIQFRYGEDGLDVSKTRGGVVDVKKIIEQTT